MANKMETELQQPIQAMDVAKPPPVPAALAADADLPPVEIVVNKKDRKSSKSHRRKGSSKDKVAKKRTSSGKHDRKKRSSKDKDGKERKERKRRHRKRKSKDPDPNDPATVAKSRELLLAAMGVKKQPDVAPCFVNNTASLDNNPVYQVNKQRMTKLAHSQSESMLAEAGVTSLTTTAATETARSMDDIAGLLAMDTGAAGSASASGDQSSSQEDSEYDQYVEF